MQDRNVRYSADSGVATLGHARGGTQITLICIAIGIDSPTAKTVHNGGSRT